MQLWQLANRCKQYELITSNSMLIPRLPVMARLDGRAFHTFTKYMDRPFDLDFINLMQATTTYLVKETNANIGYTQSDEITLTWQNEIDDSFTFFNGRIQKQASILAAMATAYFVYYVKDYIPIQKLQIPPLANFDCRVWNVPTLEEGVNAFLWRELDATKNSINMAAQEYFTHDELMHKSSKVKQEMLFQRGVNWNDYPSEFKRGTYIQKRIIQSKFTHKEIQQLPEKHEARKNPNLMVERNRYIKLELPPLSKITNKEAVIYYGDNPELICAIGANEYENAGKITSID